MEQVDLMTKALNLTFFGMGFVFVFLFLMVFMTKFMSVIIQKIQSITVTADKIIFNDDKNNNLSEDDVKLVIQRAIDIHRGV